MVVTALALLLLSVETTGVALQRSFNSEPRDSGAEGTLELAETEQLRSADEDAVELDEACTDVSVFGRLQSLPVPVVSKTAGEREPWRESSLRRFLWSSSSVVVEAHEPIEDHSPRHASDGISTFSVCSWVIGAHSS